MFLVVARILVSYLYFPQLAPRRAALERPPRHRLKGEINHGAFFRGERFGFPIPADDCVNHTACTRSPI